MRVVRSLRGLTSWSRALHREGVTIGLVPTMGALHAGHRALLREARLSCDAVVVSLFVNPSQFGAREDFSRYPRRPEADAELCRREGVDVLFRPTAAAMYPPGFQTTVAVPGLSRRWEGAARPGHFVGVATVVAKLVSLVRPTLVFLGQKDFQQAAVIRRMIEDLNLGATVRTCETVREPDGLALSSRNEYLTPAQRRAAPVLYAALHAGRVAIRAGMRRPAGVLRAMRACIAAEPLAKLEYLAVCDPDTLEPLRDLRAGAVLLGAIRLGRVRLIDNLLVTARRRRRAGA